MFHIYITAHMNENISDIKADQEFLKENFINTQKKSTVSFQINVFNAFWMLPCAAYATGHSVVYHPAGLSL